MFDRVESFVQNTRNVASEAELAALLQEICSELGFSYFALTHHVNPRDEAARAIRLHNYPAEWVAWFDQQKLGHADPVHRASNLTSVGFSWSQLPRMIHLTPRDLDILALAGSSGIGDGYTVPAHVPGEANGSCSFATAAGQALPEEHLATAHLVGAFAFEAARRLWRVRGTAQPPAQLTDRQRDCLVWAARGKSDWEIGRILGIGQETVIQHLKAARDRYNVAKRTQLAVSALFDGTISFYDILRRD